MRKILTIGATGLTVFFCLLMSMFALIGGTTTSTLSACFGSCDDSSETITTDGTSESNRHAIYVYLTKNGYSSEAAAAILGNFRAESGYNPAAIQGGTFVFGQSGFGLAQWTWHAYQQELFDYAAQKGQPKESLNLQLDYLVNKSLPGWNWGHYYGSTFEFKTTTDVEKATRAFMLRYERPEDQSEAAIQKRIEYARDALAKERGG